MTNGLLDGTGTKNAQISAHEGQQRLTSTKVNLVPQPLATVVHRRVRKHTPKHVNRVIVSAIDAFSSTRNASGGTKILNLDSSKVAVVSRSSGTIDGTEYIWATGDWSDCSADCGNGTSSRSVQCLKNETLSAVEDAHCLQSVFDVRPRANQDCQGLGVTCDDHTKVFVGAWLDPPPHRPVGATTGQVCAVHDPNYSCCNANVEESILAQVTAIKKSFATIPAAAAQAKRNAQTAIQVQAAIFSNRLGETQTALASVTAALATMDAASTKSGGSKAVLLALRTFASVLQQRALDLTAALKSTDTILSNLVAQIGVFMGDPSQLHAGGNQLENAGNSTRAGPPTLASCQDAAAHLFGSVACAACHPQFSQLTQYYNSWNNTLTLNTGVCEAVSAQCGPTLRLSREYLRKAVRPMKQIHQGLLTEAVRAQPAIRTVWQALSFDWLPAIASTNTAAGFPDLTRLACVRDQAAYALDSAATPTDFCGTYFNSWDHRAAVSSITRDVDMGVDLLATLNTCDACVHAALTQIPRLLLNGSGQVAVSLSSALDNATPTDLFAACNGLSSVPPGAASLERGTPTTTTTAPTGTWPASPSADLSAVGKYAPPATLSYSSEGLDPASLANVTWALIDNSSAVPPRPIWALNFTEDVDFAVWDLNCTSHADCNPQGDSPWVFCARPSACSAGNDALRPFGSLSCSDTELSMLEAHPKCVRGPCTNGTQQAVDGTCPDSATCPKSTEGQFGLAYFSKFHVLQPGASRDRSSARSPAGTGGVCDCAFSVQPNANGGVSSVVVDKCHQAQCIAYAQLFEPSAACRGDALAACQALQAQCPSVSCPASAAAWELPTCKSPGSALIAAKALSATKLNSSLAAGSAMGCWGLIFAALLSVASALL